MLVHGSQCKSGFLSRSLLVVCCSHELLLCGFFLIHPALISLGIYHHLLSLPSKQLSLTHIFSTTLWKPRHFTQTAWETGSAGAWPTPLSPLPPSLLASPPSPPPPWLKLTFQKEGESGWGDESALLRPASLTPVTGRLAPGVVQGTVREAHNSVCVWFENVCGFTSQFL